MGIRFFIFLVPFLFCGVFAVAQQGPPKKVVGILPAEDRFITLSDGSHIYQGLEISYLLGDKLLVSDQFTPLALFIQNSGPVVSAERLSQVPVEWSAWTTIMSGQSVLPPMELTIKPVVETLLYASGAHSNRVVYGFSPDHLNPFNEGRAGSLDNEFVASPQQLADCVKPDFFNGNFDPSGWGPFKGNYGSDLDEGFVFNVLGYGFGFKQKSFEIKSQIRFLVDDLKTGAHQEYVFQTSGKGRDIFVAGSYQGFTLGIEIQRRKTLLAALKLILPQVVDDLVAVASGNGPNANLKTLASATQNQQSSQTQQPQVFSRDLALDLTQSVQDRAALQSSSIKECFDKKTNWITDTISGLFELYALWKYKNIFDQPVHDSKKLVSTPLIKPYRIALIDSGVDYNDGDLKNVFENDGQGSVRGFDFISWDSRPSDDNGHGTAIAKLLKKRLRVPFVLIPAKVIGSHGETSSSAVYDGFDFSVKQNVDAVIVPWQPQIPSTLALQMGEALAQSAQIPVFTGIGLSSSSNANKFKVGGLGGAHLELDSETVQMIENFSNWLNSKGIKK